MVAIKDENYKGDSLKLIGICDMGCQLRDEGIKLTFYVNSEDVKLILRPLNDMTEKEFNYCYKKGWTNHYESQSAYTATMGVMEPEEFLYLLSKHFDLFCLIGSGLAINKTTLK